MPVAPAVAGDREQDLRLELTEPVEDAARPELGRARCPDRAEARGGEEGDERLGDVRQVRDDPVAAADAEPLEAGTRPRHLVAQVAEGQLEGLTRLRAREDRDRVDVLVAPQRVLRVVQLRAREPHARPGIASEASTRSYGVAALTSKKSQSEPQKPSRSVIDQRWRSW